MANRADVVAYALLATTVLAGLVLWPSLPERVAVHFGLEGRPDNYASRPVALLLAPLVGVAAVFVVRNVPAWLNDPPDSPAVLDAAVLFVAGVVALAQGFLYAWNLGYQLPVAVVVVPAAVGAGLLVAYPYAEGNA